MSWSRGTKLLFKTRAGDVASVTASCRRPPDSDVAEDSPARSVMGQQKSRAVLDSLLGKTYIYHAPVQPDGRSNHLPIALATLFFVDAAPSQLEEMYQLMEGDLRACSPPPTGIASEESKTRFLGDKRFQQSYLTYFSKENTTKFEGNIKALARFHLFTGRKPLIYGLFSGNGQPLVLLSDGIELGSPVLAVQSLALSAIDYPEAMCGLLSPPYPTASPNQHQHPGPAYILDRLAADSRFTGLMKDGPGFPKLDGVYASVHAGAAIFDYVHQLDCRDTALALRQLAGVSAMLLCATHTPGRPAFDYYLSHLPTCVNSARVVLENLFEHDSHKLLLIKGVWFLVLVTYISQMRPVVDAGLLERMELPGENRGWEVIYGDFPSAGVPQGKYGDVQFLRTLRSLWELDKAYGSVHGNLYFRAAWKLVTEWQGWTGRGRDGEVMLNVRP
ncbi:hypothetical protein VTK56DRAFT_4729 [Thermocarpiscus australiensis]